MSDLPQYDAEAVAARWADYAQILKDNPVIESAHYVNLGAMAARYRVDIDASDLDAAIAKVNAEKNVVPPISRIESATLKGDAGDVYVTSAKGANQVHVNLALRRIALQKSFRSYK